MSAKRTLQVLLVAGALAAAPSFAVAQPKPAAAPVAQPKADAKPAAAPAAQPKADAKPAAAKPVNVKALVASGEKKLAAGDGPGAVADFKAAYEAKESPETLLLLAKAHDKAGELHDAVSAYEKFAAEAPEKSKSAAEAATKRATEIKAMPGKVSLVTLPDGAAVTVDGKPAEKASPLELELAPGAHELKMVAPGHEEVEKTVDVAFASTQEVRVELPAKPTPPPPVVAEAPAPPPAPAPAPPPAPRSKLPAYVTGGIAIAAAGVGTAFGIRALGQSSDFKKNPTTSLADSGENSALVADMMFGVALTFGVTSAVLFFTNDDDGGAAATGPGGKAARVKAKPVKVTASPYVTQHGGGAGALVQF